MGRTGIVADVIAHAWGQSEFGAILMLDDHAAGNDKHDVTLVAPVVGDVFGAEVNEAKLNFA